MPLSPRAWTRGSGKRWGHMSTLDPDVRPRGWRACFRQAALTSSGRWGGNNPPNYVGRKSDTATRDTAYLLHLGVMVLGSRGQGVALSAGAAQGHPSCSQPHGKASCNLFAGGGPHPQSVKSLSGERSETRWTANGPWFTLLFLTPQSIFQILTSSVFFWLHRGDQTHHTLKLC